MHRPAAGLARRALWTLLGQGFSSASNFLLTVLVLGTASEREFATFSITVTTYLLVIQWSRALVSVPELVLYSHVRTETRDYGPPTAVALSIGVLASAGLVLAAVVLGPHLFGAREQFLALAAAVPLLVLQDNARYIAFSRSRPAIAAMSDATWIGLQLLGSLALYATSEPSVVALMTVWAVAGGVAWGLAALRQGVPPLFRGGRAWLRENRLLCRRLVAEFASTSASYYALFYGLALLAGADQLGDLKAAQTLFGPVIVLLLGGITLGVPESVRALEDPRRLRHLVAVVSASLAAVSLAVGTLVYVLLPAFGPRWFPDAWESARPLIPLFSVYAAAVGASTGFLSGLRALGASSWILRARSVSGTALLVVGLPVSWAWGAVGAVSTLAVVELAVAAASRTEFRRRSGAAGTPGDRDRTPDLPRYDEEAT